MTVTVASIFRDSAHYLPDYFMQIAHLEDALGADVRLVLAEGDSQDGTHNQLHQFLRMRGEGDTLLKVDHGGPKYGSVDVPERWAQIAYVCNAVMSALEPTGPVIYVESDLHWKPDTMLMLLEDLAICEAVAPLSMHEGRFYDLWGHRGVDGTRFRPYPPYHDDLNTEAHLVKIGSAGSCVVMRPEIAKIARFGENDAIVGLGRDIRFKCGADLWLDTRCQVVHP